MLSCQFIFFGCELVIFWAPILMQSLLGASMCPKHRINLRVPKSSSVAMATRGEPVHTVWLSNLAAALGTNWRRRRFQLRMRRSGLRFWHALSQVPDPACGWRRDTPPEAVTGSGSGGWLTGVRAARGVDPCGSGGRERTRLLGEWQPGTGRWGPGVGLLESECGNSLHESKWESGCPVLGVSTGHAPVFLLPSKSWREHW